MKIPQQPMQERYSTAGWQLTRKVRLKKSALDSVFEIATIWYGAPECAPRGIGQPFPGTHRVVLAIRLAPIWIRFVTFTL